MTRLEFWPDYSPRTVTDREGKPVDLDRRVPA